MDLKYKCSIIPFLLAVSAFVNAQTCIIFAKAPNVIYVASDSRTVGKFKKPDGTIIDTIYSTCKIERQGEMYFAMAGNAGENAYALARECAVEGKSIDSTIYLFKKYRTNQIKSELQALKNQAPRLFIGYKAKDSAFADDFFFSFEKNIPRIKEVWFKLRPDKDPSKTPQILSGIEDYSDKEMQCFGHCEAYRKLSDQDIITMLHSLGIDKTLIKMIEDQITLTWYDTAKPLELIEITSSGFHWYLNPLNCN